MGAGTGAIDDCSNSFLDALLIVEAKHNVLLVGCFFVELVLDKCFGDQERKYEGRISINLVKVLV